MSQTQNQTQAQPDQVVFTDAFKNAVRDYCEKDDQRMKLQKQLKDLRADIKDLEDTIVDFMKDNNLPVFDTGEKGLFQSKTQKQRKGLSKQLIIDALKSCEHLDDPTKAEDIAAYIYEKRPIEEKHVLQRKN
jgi:septal ring factor EnvC (AmiA/AmiB activator)